MTNLQRPERQYDQVREEENSRSSVPENAQRGKKQHWCPHAQESIHSSDKQAKRCNIIRFTLEIGYQEDQEKPIPFHPKPKAPRFHGKMGGSKQDG
jgi:hypothetical protein